MKKGFFISAMLISTSILIPRLVNAELICRYNVDCSNYQDVLASLGSASETLRRTDNPQAKAHYESCENSYQGFVEKRQSLGSNGDIYGDMSIRYQPALAACNKGLVILEPNSPPIRIFSILPSLPRQLQRKPGTVEFEFTVTKEGEIRGLRIISSTFPEGAIDSWLARALGYWQFRPRREDGKYVDSNLTQELEFK